MRISNFTEVLKILYPYFLYIFFFTYSAYSQTTMVNYHARNTTSLNGDWRVIVDSTGIGDWRQVWQEKKPQKKTDFVEYSFDGGPILQVPGDFNSQMPELTYLEGIVWYKKPFDYSLTEDKRLFLYFGAVNYMADVYLNGEKIGSHEGGFTPFQFEITDKVKQGTNTIVVRADNRRQKNGIPGYGYDWFNYGGITRDVVLIETNEIFIEDYFIQLEKGSLDTVHGWVQLDGTRGSQNIEIKIPELDLIYKTQTDATGRAEIHFKSSFDLWSPENPKRYKVTINSATDSITDTIGFRCIETQGNQVLLNKKPIFLKGVNIHEENPYKRARAYSEGDASILLESAKELGCNFVRLVHYPHNEYMIEEAEKKGLMVWEEIPVYQHIEFADSSVPQKLDTMLGEMVSRDKNRCGVVLWSLSNETYPSTPDRTDVLIDLTKKCRKLDTTRLITHVMNTQTYEDNTFNVWDPLYEYSDLIALNEYIGWYIPWQGNPSQIKWNITFSEKPVFISEFGGEALYGNHAGPADEANYWTENYQEKIYVDQTQMFENIPGLSGVCPWLLFDYRSLGRMNQVYQKGYNRKGLISENGEKKKAWYIMKHYYQNK